MGSVKDFYRKHCRRQSRRELFRRGGLLFTGGLLSAPASQAASSGGIYRSLGVRPLINARGTVTVVGGSRMLPEVQKAMQEATRDFVQIDELMEGVSRRLAEITGAEWGVVTAGAAACLTLATAACITGADPDKMAQLPDTTGLKNQVIMPSYSRVAYDHCVRAAGARIIEVQTIQALERALGPETAMILIVAGRAADQPPLGLEQIARVAETVKTPILVDAAAEGLTVPNVHLQRGAAMVAYSGGKCLRGPQCAGLLLGRKDLVQAAWVVGAPHHGFARGLKVGREEILGMLAAAEMWGKRNHDAEWKEWLRRIEHIQRRVESIPSVSTRVQQPAGLSNRTPTLLVRWDPQTINLTGHEVETLLYEGDPRVAVGGAGSFLPFPPSTAPTISIVPYQLRPGDEAIVADRVHAVLSHPPAKKPPQPPAVSVTGQWDLHIDFLAGSADHALVLEQSGASLAGTHFGQFADRDLTGTVEGNRIVMRSSYTRQGVRLNFAFAGTVEGETMQGTVSLGEYGAARWNARKHGYLPPGARRKG